jgi:hypothetical protein
MLDERRSCDQRGVMLANRTSATSMTPVEEQPIPIVGGVGEGGIVDRL